jgi:hypothetical protein
MNKLTGEEIQKREILKKVMDSDLFKEALFDVKRQIADDMLRSNDPAARERLYCQGLVLDRVVSCLDTYTTELLFLDQKRKEEAA